jgi:SanA protein
LGVNRQNASRRKPGNRTGGCRSAVGNGLGCLTLAGISLILTLIGWRVWLYWSNKPLLYTYPQEVPPHKIALVFGAGIRNGRPTPALADRVEAAAELYHAGKVSKLLMSGDNRFVSYNEPAAMKAYAQELNVPPEDIVLDYAGRRTYDSCYRARVIFGVQEAVLVTQGFHQPRAVYLCHHLGIESVGYVADNRYYSRWTRLQWTIRETLASAAAWWDVNVARPVPVLGDPIPIEDQATPQSGL